MKRKAIITFAIMLTAASLAAPQLPVMADNYSVNASADGNEGDLLAYYGNQMASPDGNEGTDNSGPNWKRSDHSWSHAGI